MPATKTTIEVLSAYIGALADVETLFCDDWLGRIETWHYRRRFSRLERRLAQELEKAGLSQVALVNIAYNLIKTQSSHSPEEFEYFASLFQAAEEFYQRRMNESVPFT